MYTNIYTQTEEYQYFIGRYCTLYMIDLLHYTEVEFTGLFDTKQVTNPFY